MVKENNDATHTHRLRGTGEAAPLKDGTGCSPWPSARSMPVSMTGKIAYVEVITPPAIRGPAGPRYFCLARDAIETRPIGVAPENPPTPISYRLARASRSGSYLAVTTRTGSV